MYVTTDTIIIGGGPAGLAMSKRLSDRSIDHVVLERGRTIERWYSERWDSLRLLTPNWMSRLPGWSYQGGDPEGFMTMPEVISYLEGFARYAAAPVHTETTVQAVTVDPSGTGFRVQTDQGLLRSRSVVVATGATGRPRIPACAGDVDGSIVQITPSSYRNPDLLPHGGVLVVGASASGVQLADEIHGSGRPVTMAVGEHNRAPRVYRGMDFHWWMDATGSLDRRIDEVDDGDAARRAPSMQLVGSPDHRSLDLAVLQRAGVRLAGRLVGIDEVTGTAHFADDLERRCAVADARLDRLLGRFDHWAAERGLCGELAAPVRPEPVRPGPGLERVGLQAEGIRSIVWATGYRPHNPWLQVPVADADGAIRHRGGITAVPGLYVLGLPFLRRRKSTFLDGFGPDAGEVADHLNRHLDRLARVTS